MTDIKNRHSDWSRLHPCKCTSYNGGQCYNCLNGAHDICSGTPKCRQARDKVIGLPIVVEEQL